jgi:predicted ATP-grasp superfamily ATP-dependent carboligase
MRIVAAWQGRVLAGVTFEKLCEHPKASGPSTVTRVIEHPEIEEMARQVVAALSYTGFAHFDFILDKASGRAFVIEMNTRATASVHLGRLFGHDVCGAMARQLGGANGNHGGDSSAGANAHRAFPA